MSVGVGDFYFLRLLFSNKSVVKWDLPGAIKHVYRCYGTVKTNQGHKSPIFNALCRIQSRVSCGTLINLISSRIDTRSILVYHQQRTTRVFQN